MFICNIERCISSSRHLFKFPKNEEICQKWTDAISTHQSIDGINFNTFRICCLHFRDDDVIKGIRFRLKIHAVPIMNNNDLSSSESQTLLQIDNFGSKSLFFEEYDVNKEVENADTETIIISKAKFKRLCEDSVQLQITKQKIERLESLLNDKNDTSKDSKIYSVHTDEIEEILSCLRFGQPKFTSYSEAVRQFCLKIHYHSPAAYECLRETFNNNLPHIRTILKWYSSINASPGLFTSSFDILAEKVKSYQDHGKQLYVSLISDEMAIKQKLQWDAVTNKFMGFATFASEKNIEKYAEQNSLPLAKQVLVFMVVGKNFKLAVAYFYLNGLSSEDRAVLTKEVIKRINQTGAKVISLTSDGFAGNIATARILGANFAEGEPFFTDPDDKARRIFIIWDPPHMLKLARNCFGSKKLYHMGRPIKWKYIEDLYKLQQDHVIRYGNKLKFKHMDWKNQKMNVGIAVQTLSNSVANGLQQAHDDGIIEFERYEATAEYIRINNNLFDIMNVKEPKDVTTNICEEVFSKKYKKPLSPSTKEEYFEYFKYAKEYFEGLFIQEDECEAGPTSIKSVFDTRSHTPFFGILNNMISLEKMYEDYVDSGILDARITLKRGLDACEGRVAWGQSQTRN